MPKSKPIITQTEILCRAIRNIEDEIAAHTKQLGDNPSFEAYLKEYVAEREAKIDALKAMYRFETGRNYI